MTLKDYLFNKFPRDLGTLTFERPNSVIRCDPASFRIDRNTVYFGGPGWKNIDVDIENIDRDDLEYFFLCLFTITTIDLNMYTHYRQYYTVFRRKTMYPKFGWCGFGVHYENPKKLLLVPEQKGLLDRDKITGYLDEYVDLLKTTCDNFFRSNSMDIDTTDFIRSMVNDKDFQVSENERHTVFELIYKKLREQAGK